MEKQVILDLDGTLLKLDISTEQFSLAKEKITDFFKTYGIVDNFRPILPKIIILSKIASKDKAIQNKIIKHCFSIIDEIEVCPDKGIYICEQNKELLANLEMAGIKVGLISNNGRIGVLSSLKKVCINENVFNFIITRDNTYLPKPFIHPYLKIDEYLTSNDCYFFTDDVFDFLPLLYLEKEHNWNIKKYLTFKANIKDESYEWQTLKRFDFNGFLSR